MDDEMDILRDFRSDQATLDEATSARIRRRVLHSMARDEYLAYTREAAQTCLIKMAGLLAVIVFCTYCMLLPEATNSMRFTLALVMLASLFALIYYALLNPHRNGNVAKALAQAPGPLPER